jgi:hypothetical protein
MRKASPFWLTAFLALLLGSGCVHTKSTIPFHEQAFNDPYFALIYVYREEGAADAGVPWEISLDDYVVGRLRLGAYLTVRVAPGAHTLEVGRNDPQTYNPRGLVGSSGKIAFKAKGSETYYLQCKGSQREFLPREQAIGPLHTMKYDRGD